MTQVAASWLTQTLQDLPPSLSWLGEREHEVLAGLRFAKRRQDWLLGRWTAKKALRLVWQEDLPWHSFEILAAEDGAPEAYRLGARLPLSLSLSHSQGVGFCAIQFSGIPIGADVEKIEARSQDFVLDYFLPGEIDRVFNARPEDQPLLATLFWSAKESALKVKREGLRIDTRQIEVLIGSNLEEPDWQPFQVKDRTSGKVWTGQWKKESEFVFSLVADATGLLVHAL